MAKLAGGRAERAGHETSTVVGDAMARLPPWNAENVKQDGYIIMDNGNVTQSLLRDVAMIYGTKLRKLC